MRTREKKSLCNSIPTPIQQKKATQQRGAELLSTTPTFASTKGASRLQQRQTQKNTQKPHYLNSRGKKVFSGSEACFWLDIETRSCHCRSVSVQTSKGSKVFLLAKTSISTTGSNVYPALLWTISVTVENAPLWRKKTKHHSADRTFPSLRSFPME